MELQRLVIEDDSGALAIDFAPGLTVAHHENPAVRSHFVDAVIGCLGTSQPGVHVEMADRSGRHLALFRPRGSAARVIDIDDAIDVSDEFAVDGVVDVLAATGFDPRGAADLMRVGPDVLQSASSTGTGDDERARRLAQADQRELWRAAEDLLAATERLAQTTESQPVELVRQAIVLQNATETHEGLQRVERVHRQVLLFGSAVAGACALAAVALVVFDARLQDDRWTAKALAALAVAAAVLVLFDRRSVRAARRREREFLAPVGVRSYDQLVHASPALADAERRGAVLAAAADFQPAMGRWRELAGDANARWANTQRRRIEAVAEQRLRARPFLDADLDAGDGQPAPWARALVDRVAWLKHGASAAGSLPLVLDEPFIGLDEAPLGQLLETVGRLAREHQIIMVTGDQRIRAWAEHPSRSREVDAVRLALRPRPQPQPPATRPTPAPTPPPGPTPAGPTPRRPPAPQTGGTEIDVRDPAVSPADASGSAGGQRTASNASLSVNAPS